MHTGGVTGKVHGCTFTVIILCVLSYMGARHITGRIHDDHICRLTGNSDLSDVKWTVFRIYMYIYIYGFCAFSRGLFPYQGTSRFLTESPRAINQATPMLARLERSYYSSCRKVGFLDTLISRTTGEWPENRLFLLTDIDISYIPFSGGGS